MPDRNDPPRERAPEPPLWEQMAQRNAQLPQGERLQKVLAIRGWGSRRVCEDLISSGRVTVNGEVAVLGRRVDTDHDRVDVFEKQVLGSIPHHVFFEEMSELLGDVMILLSAVASGSFLQREAAAARRKIALATGAVRS